MQFLADLVHLEVQKFQVRDYLILRLFYVSEKGPSQLFALGFRWTEDQTLAGKGHNQVPNA